MPDPRLLAGAVLIVLLIAAAVAYALMGSKQPPRKLAPPPHAVAAAAPKPAPVAPPPPPSPPPISADGSSGPGGPTTVTISPQILAAAGVIQPHAPAAPPPASVPPASVPAARHREHHVVAAPRSVGTKTPPISMQALNASVPEYPDVYEDSDEKGQVTVTCIIKPDGSATGCKIIHQEGGAAFAKSVLDWLALDSTRFPPLLRHGHPTALPFTWNVDFDP
jgi:outer membrane biosynthesis protein TonB